MTMSGPFMSAVRHDRYRLLRLIFIILASFAATASAQPGPAADGKNFFWKVRSEKSTVYLLGSIHFLKKSAYPLSRTIEEAFASSDSLAVEANVNDATKVNIKKLVDKALYQDEEGIEGHLSPRTLELLKKELDAAGLPFALFSRYRPWFLGLTISSFELMKQGYDPAFGIDQYFLARAEGKMKIIELESLDYQIDLLSGLSPHEEELFLRYSLEELKTMGGEVDNLVERWKRGDTEGIEEIMRKGLSGPEFSSVEEKLFYRRNRQMTAKIGEFLKRDGTVFVVVGAGHMVGPKGIVELLRADGHSVIQH